MDFKGVVEVEEILPFVVGDAAVDDRLFAGVDYDERQLNGRVGWRRSSLRLLALLVSFNQILEGDLLKWIKKDICYFPTSWLKPMSKKKDEKDVRLDLFSPSGKLCFCTVVYGVSCQCTLKSCH